MSDMHQKKREGPVRVAAWNVNHRAGRMPFRDGLPAAVRCLAADVVVLTEYVPRQQHERFVEQLHESGLEHILLSTADPPSNQVLIASRLPARRVELSVPRIDRWFHTNVLGVEIERQGITIVGLRIPTYKTRDAAVRLKCWNWVQNLAASLASRPAIIIGDLNVTADSLTTLGGGDPLRSLRATGWEFTTPAAEVSYVGPTGAGLSLDHAFISSKCAIESVQYVAQCGEQVLMGREPVALSDHAALAVNVRVSAGASVRASGESSQTPSHRSSHSTRPASPTAGSQHWLRLTVANAPKLLADALRGPLGLDDRNELEWLSPVAGDPYGDYAEYRDMAALRRLGVPELRHPLSDFWPRRGPVWDGLARTARGDLLFVEAKAHISELVTTPSRASDGPMKQIRKSLDRVKSSLAPKCKTDWCGTFYQQANRLAHLHFFRTTNGLPAFQSVLENGTHRSKSSAFWKDRKLWP